MLNALVGIILFCFASSVSATTINGKFTVTEVDGLKMFVLLQINTDSGTDDLGGTTIVFGFDTTAISFTSNPVKDVDYILHNFYGGNYSSATVTRPMKNKIWVNIDLPYVNNNSGTLVAGSPEWTDVVTISFHIVDPNGSPKLSWLTTSPFWGIYDADNLTLWQIGEFQNFTTSIETVSDLPKNYELLQNYPNPFNPSTKIRFSVPFVRNSLMNSVQLKVYDILGNEVATLVNEEKEAGNYEVEFSSANLASGIYIYRLQASEFSDTKKMILLR